MSLGDDFKKLADEYTENKNRKIGDRKQSKLRWEEAKGILNSECDSIKRTAGEDYKDRFAVEFICVNGQCILSIGPSSKAIANQELTFSFDERNDRIAITDSMGSVEHRLDLPLDNDKIDQIDARIVTFMGEFFAKLASAGE